MNSKLLQRATGVRTDIPYWLNLALFAQHGVEGELVPEDHWIGPVLPAASEVGDDLVGLSRLAWHEAARFQAKLASAEETTSLLTLDTPDWPTHPYFERARSQFDPWWKSPAGGHAALKYWLQRAAYREAAQRLRRQLKRRSIVGLFSVSIVYPANFESRVYMEGRGVVVGSSVVSEPETLPQLIPAVLFKRGA